MAQMDIFDLWQKIMAIVNTQQGGFIRPQINFQNWLNMISRELHAETFADWEVSQTVDDRLAKPFLKTVNVPLVPQTGQMYDVAPYPADYAYYSSMRLLKKNGDNIGCVCEDLDFINKKGECKPYTDPDYAELKNLNRGKDLVELGFNKIDNQRWSSVLVHPRQKPAPDRPYLTQFTGGFKIAPKGLGIVILDYIKQPIDAVFAYTIDPVTDIIIYDKANSTQLEWDSITEPEFMARLIKKYAIYTSQDNVYSIGENERKIAS